MLFYLKKHLALEVAITLLLGGVGYWGIQYFAIPTTMSASPRALIWGGAGAAAIAVWTLLVQNGYALVRGRAYADHLTGALAAHFQDASLPQMVGGLIAAAGEEVFFRGFIHGRWGIFAGALAFMVAHIGKKDIRVIGYWSFFQGLGLGIVYELSGNLLVPMVAHGLFDMGAMAYFRLRVHTGEA